MAFQNPPSLIEHGGNRFIVFDAPSDGNLQLYLQVLKRHGVTDVVRVCDPTYNADPLRAAGIALWDWSYPDGHAPSTQLINNWLKLVQQNKQNDTDSVKQNNGSQQETNNDTSQPKQRAPAIGVHCVAGLGRAPVLVAIALIENGMSSEDAIEYIRKHRRGAINANQIRFLQKYKPAARHNWKKRSNTSKSACAIL